MTTQFETASAKPAQVHADGYHTCARLEGDPGDDELVRCVGYNVFGQLGGGTTDTSPNPVAIARDVGGSVTDIGGGFYSTCATLEDSTVRCYGYNRYGDLGTMTNVGTGNPVTFPQNPGLAGISGVEGGLYFNCAVATAGTVSCAGQTASGRLGRSSPDTYELFAQTESLGGKALHHDAGHEHTCVAREDLRVLCWGDGDDGELGSGPVNFAFSPVVIPNFQLRDCDELADAAYDDVIAGDAPLAAAESALAGAEDDLAAAAKKVKKAKKKVKKAKKKLKKAKKKGNAKKVKKAKKRVKKAKKKLKKAKKAKKAAAADLATAQQARDQARQTAEAAATAAKDAAFAECEPS